MLARRLFRIAVFSYGLPVEGQKRGGIERVAHDLSNGLAKCGHKVTILTHDPRPAEALYEVRLLPWKKFVSSWLGRRLTMGYLGNILALLPNYREFDLIVALGDSLLLPLARKPLVRVMCGSALGEAKSASSPIRFVMQLGVYAQELLTGLTQKGCVAISHNTRRDNPFVSHVIPIGVDLRKFSNAAAQRTDEPSILFVGALDGRKRGRLLLEWFTTVVRPQIKNARLFMVCAPGPTVDGVTYYKGISDAELAALYRSAWIYASPSSYEGFGLPYVEAMASGMPVVATPNPGSLEVLGNGEFGLLVADADFARVLVELLSDEKQRHRLTTNGLERAQEYSIDSTVEQYEQLFVTMCASKDQLTQHV
ncbi:MAG TPA: glycosyltransferase family 4 protein [Pyrinomonadaceae bacterium]|jgi:glycosyltransferase involved in cell wall biosynthesis|nr:glycosyltransferase family 4 protein [Pyrinomonadaceae bacterium]